jgi:hypothetical protein
VPLVQRHRDGLLVRRQPLRRHHQQLDLCAGLERRLQNLRPFGKEGARLVAVAPIAQRPDLLDALVGFARD